MNKRLTLAVEGICCVGKTMLIERIQSRGGCIVVDDYGEYVKSFPPVATSGRELLANLDFFLSLEARRFDELREISTSHEQIILLDRSFITCCAFDYAATRGTRLARYLPRIEARWRETDKKIMPNHIITLTLSRIHFLERLAASGRTLTPLLRDAVFNARFSEYLLGVNRRWGIKTTLIDTDQLSVEQVEGVFWNIVESV